MQIRASNLFEARFRQTLKKTVVFPDCFEQVVCSGYAPSFHKVAFCLFGLSFAHPTHCCHKMKEHFRDGVARLLHPQGVFCHSYAAAVIAGKVCLVSHGGGLRAAGRQLCKNHLLLQVASGAVGRSMTP